VTNPQRANARALVRGEPVVAKVLEAAREELALRGYGELTIEAVAARAGVARTTLYRRWATKAELVRAAIASMPGGEASPIDLGSLRADLVEFGMRVVRFSDKPMGRAIMALFADVHEGDELRALLQRMREERSAELLRAFDRARGRGERIGAGDAELVAELLPAALFNKRMVLRERITRRGVERIVDFLLACAATARGPAA
jgi:AcrR family transcriptional regulator